MIAGYARLTVSGKTVGNLRVGGWLSDECVMAAMHVVIAKTRGSANVRLLNTYFYSKLMEGGQFSFANIERWLRRFPMFEQDVIIVPIHQPNHWVLAILLPQLQQIETYDSLRHGTPAEERMGTIAHNLNRMIAAAREARGLPEEKAWSHSLGHPPQQKNGNDCGVCMVATAGCRLADRQITPSLYTGADIRRLRLWLQWAILKASQPPGPAPSSDSEGDPSWKEGDELD